MKKIIKRVLYVILFLVAAICITGLRFGVLAHRMENKKQGHYTGRSFCFAAALRRPA
jgi:hypothetical protein